ncbi:MAG: hypothetical protein ACK5JD_11015 [Mangrovibacterium sp.]
MDKFYELVARMRRMQNMYFATKDADQKRGYLIASKETEKQVDAALHAEGYHTVSPEHRQNQQKLF